MDSQPFEATWPLVSVFSVIFSYITNQYHTVHDKCLMESVRGSRETDENYANAMVRK